MLKRIICLIFTASILISANVSAFIDVTESAAAIETIAALGLIKGFENDTFRPEEPLTRAGYAEIIKTIFDTGVSGGENEWFQTFFEDEQNELALKTGTPSVMSAYEDVSPAHPSFGAIQYVTSFKFMNGVTKTLFEPERPILLKEALKPLVKLLGYEIKADLNGGYPSGYIRVASDIGITKGLGYNVEGEITRGQMANLLYKSLNVLVLQQVIFGANRDYKTIEGETFLTKILKVYKLDGQMTANDITGLTGPSAIKKNSVIIKNVSVDITDETAYVNDFIGKPVSAYYKYDEDTNKSTLIYARVSENNISKVIDGATITAFSGNVLSYEINDRIFTVSISAGTPMIYNGLAVSSYDSSNFLMTAGSVEIIQNNSRSDLIIVNKYETMYISSKNSDKMEIFNKISDNNSNTDDEILKIDADDITYRVSIYTPDGKNGGFEDLMAGQSINVARNGKVFKILISNLSVRGTVSEMTFDKHTLLNIENKWYELSSEYENSKNKIEVYAGDNLTLYLDSFGRVAWIEKSVNDGERLGYVVKVEDEKDLSTGVRVKLFNTEGKMVILGVSDKLQFEDENGIETTLKDASLFAALENLSGLVSYRLNSEGFIRRIELPLTYSTNEHRLHRIFKTTPAMGGNIIYKSTPRTFGGKVYVGGTTQIMGIAADPLDDKAYKLLNNTAFINDNSYEIDAYSIAPHSAVADIILVSTRNTSNSIDPRSSLVVITKRAVSIDDEGTVIEKIYGMSSGNEVSFTAENITGIPSPFDAATTSFSTTEYEIKTGDMVRCLVDAATGHVTKVSLVYSPSRIDPISGKNGTLVGALEKYYVASYLVDRPNNTHNVYEMPSNDIRPAGRMGNPYALNGETLMGYAHRFHMYDVRTLYGYVHSVNGNYVAVTTQNIRTSEYIPSGIPLILDDGGEVGYEGIYLTDTFDISRFRITKVDYKDSNTVSSKTATADDLTSYVDSGISASKVLVTTRSGEPQEFIIINDDN